MILAVGQKDASQQSFFESSSFRDGRQDAGQRKQQEEGEECLVVHDERQETHRMFGWGDFLLSKHKEKECESLSTRHGSPFFPSYIPDIKFDSENLSSALR